MNILRILLFFCLAFANTPGATGRIIVDPEYSHTFRYSSGERFFPMGDTAYFLIAQPTNVIARYIDSRRAHRFNFVRAMVMAEGFWPFGGTPKNPDYNTINQETMRKWEWVFDYAERQAMSIELILWGYGIGGGEGLWAREADQNFWIDAVVSRFKGRKNLFMWTIANEFERYPDGRYHFDASDVEWARRAALIIRRIDPIHPVGCHPSVWITDQDETGGGPRPFGRYRGFVQRLPQVVWPLWEGSVINLNVTQNNEGVQRRTWGNLDSGGRGLTYYPTTWKGAFFPAEWTATGWIFEAPGLEESLAQEWVHGKPVLNLEFGYQYEPGYENGRNYLTRQVHHPSTVRKKAWKIAVSGGYFAAGFESVAVRNFNSADIENFRPQPLETLYDFFTTRTEFWRMAPRLDLVASHNVLLARPGSEYVAYFPRGGTNFVMMEAGSYRLEWLHPATGQYVDGGSIEVREERREFSPPDRRNDDWVLHVKSR